jgi:hypothetical protein
MAELQGVKDENLKALRVDVDKNLPNVIDMMLSRVTTVKITIPKQLSVADGSLVR